MAPEDRKIYLDVAGRMHSLYRLLIDYPPEGYRFITRDPGWDKAFNAISRVNTIYSFQQNILTKILPVNLAKAYLERFKKTPEDTDLTYATGHLVFRKEPWVVDLEFVTQLAGYSIKHFRRYKKLIERVLSSGHCRKIICWTEAGKKSVLANMDCRGFEDKVEVVLLAVPKKNFIKDYSNRKKVKLLFVGSANIPGEFEYKGGKEVLEAFMLLRKKYSNLELVIRSDIPKQIRDKYSGLGGLRLIEGIIPWQQLEQEFRSADIFLLPSHHTPGLAILDAMSYQLPVITSDVWANSEMVKDGETGFVIRQSEKVSYYIEDAIPNWDYHLGTQFMESIKTTNPKVVEDLTDKAGILIENRDLRRKMGRAGRQQIDTGKFSIEKRNEKLKRIFDEAIGDTA